MCFTVFKCGHHIIKSELSINLKLILLERIPHHALIDNWFSYKDVISILVYSQWIQLQLRNQELNRTKRELRAEKREMRKNPKERKVLEEEKERVVVEEEGMVEINFKTKRKKVIFLNRCYLLYYLNYIKLKLNELSKMKLNRSI